MTEPTTPTLLHLVPSELTGLGSFSVIKAILQLHRLRSATSPHRQAASQISHQMGRLLTSCQAKFGGKTDRLTTPARLVVTRHLRSRNRRRSPTPTMTGYRTIKTRTQMIRRIRLHRRQRRRRKILHQHHHHHRLQRIRILQRLKRYSATSWMRSREPLQRRRPLWIPLPHRKMLPTPPMPTRSFLPFMASRQARQARQI